MKKKLNLNRLKVQSFVTGGNINNHKTIQGGNIFNTLGINCSNVCSAICSGALCDTNSPVRCLTKQDNNVCNYYSLPGWPGC